jgi:mono/diheme cytochrome c family protein
MLARIPESILLLWFLLVLQTPACASEKYIEARGLLLYSTHCNACHTTQVHWREQKLVTDWDSLVAEVRRWQYISGLGWSEDDVEDVAYHLDRLFYHYKNPAQLMYKD